MIAIIKTGGKQYRVEEGGIISVEKLEGEIGAKVSFEEVLMKGDEKDLKVGNPFIKDSKVEAEIVGHDHADKVFGIKHKAKKRQLKKFGHKQPMTQLKILKIS
ncbi:MAG TPA: 50S ribosomal protein L21 [Candidatus Moranbacteria bacterium]|nr:50S ribosomal protein L21 [Candidatus Moranbacteria bacterium]